jgi:hypothetical protein
MSTLVTQGDSGGPILDVTSGKQVGIVSFGGGCNHPYYPGGMSSFIVDFLISILLLILNKVSFPFSLPVAVFMIIHSLCTRGK